MLLVQQRVRPVADEERKQHPAQVLEGQLHRRKGYTQGKVHTQGKVCTQGKVRTSATQQNPTQRSKCNLYNSLTFTDWQVEIIQDMLIAACVTDTVRCTVRVCAYSIILFS